MDALPSYFCADVKDYVEDIQPAASRRPANICSR